MRFTWHRAGMLARHGMLFSLFAVFAIWSCGCGSPGTDPVHARNDGCPTRAVPQFKMGQPDVVLLVTGGTNALLETCNCAGPMAGGTSKRSALIQSYRKAFPRTILIDSGDVLTTSSVLDDSRFADLSNDYVMMAYNAMGYDVVAIGDQEWVSPHERLIKLMADSKIKFLSTNVRPLDSLPKLPIVPEVKFQWGNVKVAILSDLREEWLMFFPQDRFDSLVFDPVESLAKRAAELKKQGYIIVVASHCRYDGYKQTVAEVKPDLVIRGNTTQTVEEIIDDDGTPVIKVGDYAYVGVIAMKFANGKISAIEYRPEVVDDRWPCDGKQSQIYQAYVHSAMRLVLDAGRKKGIDYVTSDTCGQCHPSQYEHWRNTRHSRAWSTLVNAGRTSDPNCMACHTTGFRTEKGFYTIDKTPSLANVNCQDCHRFAVAEHHQDGFDRKKYKVTDSVCQTCHTQVTDPKFTEDVKKKLKTVGCPPR